MKKILALSFGAVLLVGAALALHAQGSGSIHHTARHSAHMGASGHMKGMMEFVAKELDLTDAQKAAAHKIHAELEVTAEPLMELHHQQFDEIHAMLARENPDATEVGRKLITAHETGKQLQALHEEAMAKFNALLNADQLEKVKKYEMHRGHEGSDVPEL